MDIEEDVVYEDSPLARHLTACGIDVDLESREVEVSQEKVSTLSDTISRKIWGVIKGIKHLVNQTYVFDVYREACVGAILDCNILERDDIEIIKETNPYPDVSSQEFAKRELIKRGLRDSLVAFIPAATLFLMPTSWRPAKVLPYIPPATLLWRWRSLLSAPSELKKLVKFLEKACGYDKQLKKALTIIGDNSLISRGYMMAQNSSQIWRLETNEISDLSRRSRSTLPGLRIAAMETTYRLAMAYSAATNKLKKERPLPMYLDHPALYLPDFGLEDRHVLMDLKDEDQNVTIPSLGTLKSAVEILHLKQSEYLRRIALDLMASHFTKSLNVEISHAVNQELLDCSKELEMALILHRSYFSETITGCKLRDTKQGADKIDRHVFDFHTYYHSCSVHLQEALFRSRELEEAIENCSDISSLDVDQLTEDMERVLHHVDSTTLCLKRAIILTAKLSSLPIAESENASAKDDPVESEVEASGSIEDFSYTPQDEIFEIFNSKTSEDDSSVINDDEGEGCKRKEKESTAIVMKELKDVLKVKAADWMEREKKVKLRGKPVNRKSFVQDTTSEGQGSQDEEKWCINAKDIAYLREGGRFQEGLEGSSSEGTCYSNATSQLNITVSDASLGPGTSSQSLLDERDWASNSSSSWIMPQVRRPAPAVESTGPGCSGGMKEEGECVMGRLAAEAVAKARANKTEGMPMMEEAFVFLGQEEND